MSKPEDKKPDEKKPAARKKRSLIVKTDNPGFTGERNGLKFIDGECRTDNAIAAHGCLELGYSVVDAESGKPAWDDEQDAKTGE